MKICIDKSFDSIPETLGCVWSKNYEKAFYL